MVVPAVPYRGIHPFRYADHPIFFARERETRQLIRLVDVYRGVFLYGDSGNGKSSLVNAGLLPRAHDLGFEPVRVRVQPRAGEELVVEQIAARDDGSAFLPCVLAADDERSARIVLSIEQFEERLRSASREHQPLIVFDQFEEILTLFEDDAARLALAAMIIRLLRESLPVKLLFAFREDYLGRVKQLLQARPELVDQSLRLGPPPADALDMIIRGPFQRHPGHFEHELDPTLAERLRKALAERFGAGEVSLSEVQTVCLRLWQSADPAALLESKGVQGLLEEELGEALAAFTPELRAAAIALLSQMVTSAGTRNVVSAEDLHHRVRDDDGDIPPELLDEALERLERDSRLVRRERRRDIYLYEITSEFLVPWISQRREELRAAQGRRKDELRRERERARERERRRLRVLGTTSGVLFVVVAVVALLAYTALRQNAESERLRSETQRQASNATSLALAASATSLVNSRPDVALALAYQAYREKPRVEARGSLITALRAARDPGIVAILHGHSDDVASVAFSRDGRTLASAGSDNTIRLWNTHTHKPLGRPLTGHSAAVRAVAFSPNGRLLASAGADKTVRLWNPGTQRQIGRAMTAQRPINGVAFSRDGGTLATAGADKTVRLWDVRTHRQLGHAFTGHSVVYGVAFSRDGNTLASAGYDGTIRLWDTLTGKPLGRPLSGPTGAVRAVAFSPNGRLLASAGPGTSARLWDPRTHEQVGAAVSRHRLVRSVAFAPDGRTLATAGADASVRLWSVRTHRQLGHAFTGHAGVVNSVAFSPDGRTFASAGGDTTVRLWDVRRREQLGQPLGHNTGSIFGVAFRPDGRVVASAGADDGRIRLWDVRRRKQLGSALAGHPRSFRFVPQSYPVPAGAIAVAFSPDGRTLASGGNDANARLWNVRTHEQQGKPLGLRRFVYSVAFSPDGRILATTGDASVRFWDVRSHRSLGRAPTRRQRSHFVFGSDGFPHSNVLRSVAFSPDGAIVATAGLDKVIRFWDARTHRQVGAAVTGHTGDVNGLAFSPDGRTLASASFDRTIRLWDVRTHKELGEPLTGHVGPVRSVAFSPDGQTLASVGDDRTLRLWDVPTHRQIGQALRGHTGPVASVAFSPDGRTLATGGFDRSLRLWDGLLWRSRGELRTAVCALLGTGLSTDEWRQYAASGIGHPKDDCP